MRPSSEHHRNPYLSLWEHRGEWCGFCAYRAPFGRWQAAEIVYDWNDAGAPCLAQTQTRTKLDNADAEWGGWSGRRDKQIGGSGGPLGPLGLFLNLLGLFLRTSVPFIWPVLSAFPRA